MENNKKFYVDVEAYKTECIEKGIWPAVCNNTLEKLKTDKVEEKKTADLILMHNASTPGKPWHCTNCSRPYSDYVGITFCSGCGAKIEKIY